MTTVHLLDNPSRKPKKKAGRKATPKQRAAARRNLKKARAAQRRKRSGSSTSSRRRTRSYSSRKRHTYYTRGPKKGQRKGRYVYKAAKVRGRNARGRKVTVRTRKRYYTNPSSLMLLNPGRRVDPVKFLMTLVGLSAVAYVGALAARKLPPMLLKEKDVGPMGYAANGLTAAVLGLAVGKFMRMPDVGLALSIGGGVATAARIASEKSPGGPLVLAGTPTWRFPARTRSAFRGVGAAKYQRLGAARYQRLGAAKYQRVGSTGQRLRAVSGVTDKQLTSNQLMSAHAR